MKKQVSFYEDQLFKIDIKKLQKHKEHKAYLYYMLKGFGFSEWSDIEGLMNGQSGKLVSSKTHRLIKNREFLLLEEKNLLLQQSKVEISNEITEINSPISISFECVKKVNSATEKAIFIAADTLKYPLSLRKKEEGDYFLPFGMNGKKKLSKYFKDEKLSLIEKENTWLLCDADNVIIWIVGRRSDDRFKVLKSTKKILKIKIN